VFGAVVDHFELSGTRALHDLFAAFIRHRRRDVAVALEKHGPLSTKLVQGQYTRVAWGVLRPRTAVLLAVVTYSPPPILSLFRRDMLRLPLRDLLAFRNIDVRPGFGTGLHTKGYFYLPGDPTKWIGVKFGPDSGVCTSSTKKLFVFHRPGLTTATNNVKQQEVRKTTNGIFSWTIESRACATGAVTRSKTHKRFPKRSGIFARR